MRHGIAYADGIRSGFFRRPPAILGLTTGGASALLGRRPYDEMRYVLYPSSDASSNISNQLMSLSLRPAGRCRSARRISARLAAHITTPAVANGRACARADPGSNRMPVRTKPERPAIIRSNHHAKLFPVDARERIYARGPVARTELATPSERRGSSRRARPRLWSRVR
jgi:hypothetical protein